jgi:hypothetical protein
MMNSLAVASCVKKSSEKPSPLGIDVTAAGSLGLELVCGQVAQLSGRIALDRGGGSAITVIFPIEPGTGRREVKS